MTKAKELELLKGVSLFEELSRKELNAVHQWVRQERFPQGHVLVQEGAPSQTFYVLTSGTAKVKRGNRTIRMLGPGDYLGEIAAIDRQPRSATVIADTPVEVLAIPASYFRPLLLEHPTIAYKIILVLCRRLRAAERNSLL